MNAQEIEKIIERNGTERTIVIFFLLAVVIIAGTFLKEYMKDKDERRQEAEEKRKLDKERNQNYVEIIKKITETMSQNSYRIEDFSKQIEKHQSYSNDNFKSINSNLQDIKEDLSVVSGMTDKMATKEGLEEVKSKVEDLIKALE